MTDFTAAERTKLAAIENADWAPEALRERVARAISETRDTHAGAGFPCRCGWEAGFGKGWEKRVDRHRRLAAADAAIAVIAGGHQ
jgi:hypothetical protein